MPFMGKVQGGSRLNVSVAAGSANPGVSALFVHWDTGQGAPAWPQPLVVPPGGVEGVEVQVPPATLAQRLVVNLDLPDGAVQAQVSMAVAAPAALSWQMMVTADATFTFVIV